MAHRLGGVFRLEGGVVIRGKKRMGKQKKRLEVPDYLGLVTERSQKTKPF